MPTTLIPHLVHEPRKGTWWRSAKRTFWGCPKCGQAHELTTHEVNEDGHVSPSVGCGRCDFHDYVSFEEVSPETVTDRARLRPADAGAYDPTTQPYDEPFRHVTADAGEDAHQVLHLYEGDSALVIRDNGNSTLHGDQHPALLLAMDEASGRNQFDSELLAPPAVAEPLSRWLIECEDCNARVFDEAEWERNGSPSIASEVAAETGGLVERLRKDAGWLADYGRDCIEEGDSDLEQTGEHIEGIAERLSEAAAALSQIQAELTAARHEASCCDDIKLDQPLAGIIADLQKAREELDAKLIQQREATIAAEQREAELKAALHIATNDKLSLLDQLEAAAHEQIRAMTTALELWAAYDDILRRFEGPATILAGDVKEIDDAYDKCVSATRAILADTGGQP